MGNNTGLSTDKYVQSLYSMALDCLDVPIPMKAARPKSAHPQEGNQPASTDNATDMAVDGSQPANDASAAPHTQPTSLDNATDMAVDSRQPVDRAAAPSQAQPASTDDAIDMAADSTQPADQPNAASHPQPNISGDVLRDTMLNSDSDDDEMHNDEDHTRADGSTIPDGILNISQNASNMSYFTSLGVCNGNDNQQWPGRSKPPLPAGSRAGGQPRSRPTSAGLQQGPSRPTSAGSGSFALLVSPTGSNLFDDLMGSPGFSPESADAPHGAKASCEATPQGKALNGTPVPSAKDSAVPLSDQQSGGDTPMPSAKEQAVPPSYQQPGPNTGSVPEQSADGADASHADRTGQRPDVASPLTEAPPQPRPYTKLDPAAVPLATKAGAVYALYCIYETQPGRIPIYMPLEMLQQLLVLVKATVATVPDVARALQKLMSKGAIVVGAIRRPPRGSAAEEAAALPPNRLAASSLVGTRTSVTQEREAVYHVQSMYRGLTIVGNLAGACKEYRDAKLMFAQLSGENKPPKGIFNLGVGAKLAQMLNKATTEIQPKLARRFMRRVRRDSKAGRKAPAPASGPAPAPQQQGQQTQGTPAPQAEQHPQTPAPATAPAPAAEGQQTQGQQAPQAEQPPQAAADADDGGLDSILDACLADLQSDDESAPIPAPQGFSKAPLGDEEDSDEMDSAENLANLSNIRGGSGFRAAQTRSDARRRQHQYAVAAWQSFEDKLLSGDNEHQASDQQPPASAGPASPNGQAEPSIPEAASPVDALLAAAQMAAAGLSSDDDDSALEGLINPQRPETAADAADANASDASNGVAAALEKRRAAQRASKAARKARQAAAAAAERPQAADAATPAAATKDKHARFRPKSKTKHSAEQDRAEPGSPVLAPVQADDTAGNQPSTDNQADNAAAAQLSNSPTAASDSAVPKKRGGRPSKAKGRSTLHDSHAQNASVAEVTDNAAPAGEPAATAPAKRRGRPSTAKSKQAVTSQADQADTAQLPNSTATAAQLPDTYAAAAQLLESLAAAAQLPDPVSAEAELPESATAAAQLVDSAAPAQQPVSAVAVTSPPAKQRGRPLKAKGSQPASTSQADQATAAEASQSAAAVEEAGSAARKPAAATAEAAAAASPAPAKRRGRPPKAPGSSRKRALPNSPGGPAQNPSHAKQKGSGTVASATEQQPAAKRQKALPSASAGLLPLTSEQSSADSQVTALEGQMSVVPEPQQQESAALAAASAVANSVLVIQKPTPQNDAEETKRKALEDSIAEIEDFLKSDSE